MLKCAIYTFTIEPNFTDMTQLTTLPANADGSPADQGLLLSALEQLLMPMARLCVARGVSIQALEERLRRSVVRAARETCEQQNPDHPKGRLTSRISTMTGLTRREVARLEAEAPPRRNSSRSRVADLFAHWLAEPGCRSPDGDLVPLRRTGEHPSFEMLAAAVTQDVHPRSLLDEMIRLDLVEHDLASDRVSLRQDAFVPRGQWSQLLAYLGDNVGDHLDAAVCNVLGQGKEQFEQALFADELSAQSITQARPLISAQWQHLMSTLAPALQALMDQDRMAGRTADQCLRIGLYSMSRPMPTPEPGPQPDSSAESPK